MASENESSKNSDISDQFNTTIMKKSKVTQSNSQIEAEVSNTEYEKMMAVLKQSEMEFKENEKLRIEEENEKIQKSVKPRVRVRLEAVSENVPEPAKQATSFNSQKSSNLPFDWFCNGDYVSPTSNLKGIVLCRHVFSVNSKNRWIFVFSMDFREIELHNKSVKTF